MSGVALEAMPVSRLASLKRLFWRSFFRLVVFTAAIAEWACITWVLIVVLDLHVPWPLHLLGPVALHLANGRLLGSRPGPPASGQGAFVRSYVGVVFASLFGLVVLLLNAALWSVVAATLGLASVLGAPVTADVVGAAQLTGSVGLLVVSTLIAWGYGPGQSRVHELELDVAMPHLGPAFDGFRIVQISDIHLGRYMDEARLAAHVEQINALRPDLVCITGDITDGLDHAPRTFPVLGQLRARHGVLAILGNHDFYTGADEVTAALRRLTPFRVLRDESVVFERDGSRLHVLGVDDAGQDWTRGVREHYALAPLAARVPAAEAMLLLSHRPELFAQAAALRVGLVLSGHTHGGQLALPWPSVRPSLAHFISDFPRGTYRIGSSTLHVNLGLGVTGQPVRVFSPREITVITLRSEARGNA